MECRDQDPGSARLLDSVVGEVGSNCDPKQWWKVQSSGAVG